MIVRSLLASLAAVAILLPTLPAPEAAAQAPDQFGIADRIRAGRAKASAYAQPAQPAYGSPGGEGGYYYAPAPDPTMEISAGETTLSVPVGGARAGQGLVADTVNIFVNVQNGDNNVASNTVTVVQGANE